MKEVILIAMFISRQNIPQDMKSKISACVFYGVKKKDNINLFDKLEECLKENKLEFFMEKNKKMVSRKIIKS